MKIEVYCLANNEERLMPYFLRHYSFAKVIILESNSTDKTIEIAHSMGAEIWSYDVKDEINDQWFTDLKNNCWKESKADWVMIVDADEFIYHPQIEDILTKSAATIIKPRFFNMYSTVFPTTEGQIYEEVTMGVEQFSPSPKMNIFRPNAIKNIGYFPGCHEAFPTGKIKIDSNSGIFTLHMRNLSEEFIVSRNTRAKKRNSQLNKLNGWGSHVECPEAEWIRRYEEGLKESTKII